MSDMRDHDETALTFVRTPDDEPAPADDAAVTEHPDAVHADGSVIEDDVNDVEAALNPDEQYIERPASTDQDIVDLDQIEGEAGD